VGWAIRDSHTSLTAKGHGFDEHGLTVSELLRMRLQGFSGLVEN
jgi:hypothetical protein